MGDDEDGEGPTEGKRGDEGLEEDKVLKDGVICGGDGEEELRGEGERSCNGERSCSGEDTGTGDVAGDEGKECVDTFMECSMEISLVEHALSRWLGGKHVGETARADNKGMALFW